MLFTKKLISELQERFRKSISNYPFITLNKRSTIDNLCTSIFFGREAGSIKAQAHVELVYGDFAIPDVINEFSKKGYTINSLQAKEIIFNTLDNMFNIIEPSVVGYKYCNQCQSGDFWFQDYPLGFALTGELPKATLNLYRSNGLGEVMSLAGCDEEYPSFDADTAEVYCSLFNKNMGIKGKTLHVKDPVESLYNINVTSYASIFNSQLIQLELSCKLANELLPELINELENHIETDDLNLICGPDFIELVSDHLSLKALSLLVEDHMHKILNEIRIKFALLASITFLHSNVVQAFIDNLIIKIAIPERTEYLEAEIGSNLSVKSYLQIIIKEAMYDISTHFLIDNKY